MAKLTEEERINQICTPHTLADGRLAYTGLQVYQWPKELREWIVNSNYWQVDLYHDYFVSPWLDDS